MQYCLKCCFKLKKRKIMKYDQTKMLKSYSNL
uniref:Uncharacterized protein n=1 Tax=Anguilla anguilla TaxID=7936 RepID=A0A0E9WB30_ANGAN